MPSTPTPNKVSICSTALVTLGAKPISSFTDGTDRATICARIYPSLKDDILSIHDWKFTVGKVALGKKADAPISTYSNEWQLPQDRLTDGVIALYDSNAAGASVFKDFEVQGDGILTEAAALYLDYQSNGINEAVWPPYFVSLIIKALMVEFSMPITDQTGIFKTLDQMVYGTVVENRRGGVLGRAMARNSREDPPQVFTDFSLIQARSEGS